MSKTRAVRGNDYRVPRKSGQEAFFNNLNPLGRSAGVGFRLVFDGTDRIYRGGSWDSTESYAHAAGRAFRASDFPGDLLGFRLVWERP